MALARPLRFLGVLTVALFFFLVYLFLKPPPVLEKPGGQNGEIIESMERDPLLDRMSIQYFEPDSLTDPSQLLANPPNHSGAPTITAQTIQTLHA